MQLNKNKKRLYGPDTKIDQNQWANFCACQLKDGEKQGRMGIMRGPS